MRRIGDDSWRWMLASSAIPALIVLCLRLGTPESPRWLASRGRVDEANEIIARVFGPDVVLGPQEQVSRARIRDLFAGPWRKRTAFASVFWFCQVLPFFALFTFAPKVLASLGLHNEFTGDLILNVFQLAGGVVGVLIMNSIPRRGFTLWSFIILVVSLLPLAIAPSPPSVLVIACFAVFAFVVSGAGNLETVYPSELFPTRLRATGVGFAASMSRVGAAIGTFLLPISLQQLGNQVTMGIGAAVLAVGAVTTWFWAPETRHLVLADSANAELDAGTGTAVRADVVTEA